MSDNPTRSDKVLTFEFFGFQHVQIPIEDQQFYLHL